MKRFVKMLVGLLMLVSLVGCADKAENAYQGAFKDGITAIDNEAYEKAEAFFETAQKAKNTKEIKSHIQQLEIFQEIQSHFKQGNLTECEDSLIKLLASKEGSKVLIERSRLMQRDLEDVKRNLASYEEIYNEAEAHHQMKEFDESDKKIEMLKEKDLTVVFYRTVGEKAESLLKLNADGRREADEIKKKNKAEWLSTDDPQKYVDAYFEFKDVDLGIVGIGGMAEKNAYRSINLTVEQFNTIQYGIYMYYKNLINHGEITDEELQAAQELASNKLRLGEYSYIYEGQQPESRFTITEGEAIKIAEDYMSNHPYSQGVYEYENMNPGKIFIDGDNGFYNIYFIENGQPMGAVSVDAKTGAANDSVLHFRGIEVVTENAPQ